LGPLTPWTLPVARIMSTFHYDLDAQSVVTLKAASTVIADDFATWSCKGYGPTKGIQDFDVTQWDDTTWTLGGVITVSNCAKIQTGPGGIVGLVVAIVQACILMALGPTIAIYGPAFRRFVFFVQAVVVSSYILLINDIVTVDWRSGFYVFEKTVTLFITVFAVTYSSVKSPGVAARASGFAMGNLLAKPIIDFVVDLLYQGPIGCNGPIGDKSIFFPNGEPTGCDQESVEFQLVYQLSQFLKWIVIITVTWKGESLINLATAVTGSTMFIKGFVDITKAIGFEYFADHAALILRVVTPVRAWAVYGVALVAYIIQRKLLKEVPPAEEGNKATYEEHDKQPLPCNILCKKTFLLTVCHKIDNWLERNLALIGDKKAMQAKLAKSVTKTKKKDADGNNTVNV